MCYFVVKISIQEISELCNRLESISDESIVVPNNIFNVLSDTKSPQGVMLVLKNT